MHVVLPFDILFRIVELFFEDTPKLFFGKYTTDVGKPKWAAIENLISASRTLRTIGLKMWFMRLRSVQNGFLKETFFLPSDQG